MIRLAFLPLAALFILSPALAKTPRFPPSTGQSALYVCADRRSLEVLYSGGDAVVLTIAGEPVQLERAVSASGERYVGGGWQWWGTGLREGMLSRLAEGEQVASAAGINCRVR